MIGQAGYHLTNHIDCERVWEMNFHKFGLKQKKCSQSLSQESGQGLAGTSAQDIVRLKLICWLDCDLTWGLESFSRLIRL